MQIRALLAFALRAPDPSYLRDTVKPLEKHLRDGASIAPVVRVLAAIALLDQGELLGADGADADWIAGLVAQRLHDAPRLASGGWISVEATAELTLGLIALYRHGSRGDQELEEEVAGHVATGAAALRRGRRRYHPTKKGVAWLARLTHAAIVADRHFPIGLQRLSTLEWPDGSAGASERRHQAVLEELAQCNEQLRLGKAETDHKLAEQRLAGPLGRATATLIPVLLLGAALVFVVLQIGWQSLGGVLANIGVLLGVLLSVLGGIFAVLKANYLLASPAARLRDWMASQGAPVVSQLAKLKRG